MGAVTNNAPEGISGSLMTRTSFSLPTLLLVLLAPTTVARVAHAEPSDEAPKHGAKWVIEVDGAACRDHKAIFEREIALACEAMGTCRVVPRSDAELEAVLHCDDDAGARGSSSTWRLQTRTVEGTNLMSLDLSGSTPGDRMREAAIEIARDAAPERTLAAESLRNTFTDADKLKITPPSPPPKLVVSLSGLTSAREREAAGFGARASAGYRVHPAMHLMFSVLGSGGGGTGIGAFRRVRSGVGAAFGAPYSDHWVGVAFDTGIDGTEHYATRYTATDLTMTARTEMAAYLQQTITVQAPLKYVRPYLAGSIALLSTAPIVTASADLGISVPIF